MRGGGIVNAERQRKTIPQSLPRQLPLHKGAFGHARASLGVWALPEARVVCNAIKRYNTKAKLARDKTSVIN